MLRRFLVALSTALLLAAGLVLAKNSRGFAQTCWFYSDVGQAKVPLMCVRQDNPAADCLWNPSCHLTDLGSCCTSRPAAAPQTILSMHTKWHECFGPVGTTVGQNPPGRSARWYAFHRQFEIDFNQWRVDHNYSPIESVEWCPNMTLDEGHGGANLMPGEHPGGCGTGPNRPDGELCPGCEAFPQCMFFAGAGPGLCPAAPSAVCGKPGTAGLPHTSLDQFPHADQISEVLDNYFHGDMHQAVANANCNFTTGDNCYNQDAADPSCSPRDPMFWRLHKALDDVVRAWQDSKAVDVVVVVDTSGSMSAPDATGISKLQAAVNAVDTFGDLLEDVRTDGQTNRIGIVTYSDGPVTALPMTSVTPTLRAPGGAFRLALDGIVAAGPAGCTGTGAGIERALELLCPPTGNCSEFSTA
jgi:hypothetical protein